MQNNEQPWELVLKFEVSSKDETDWAHVDLSALNVAPDRIWHKGDVGAGRMPVKTSGIYYSAHAEGTGGLEELTDAIFERVRAAGPAFNEVAKRYGSAMRVALYLYSNDTPSMGLRDDQLDNLAAYRASLDIDMYVLIGE